MVKRRRVARHLLPSEEVVGTLEPEKESDFINTDDWDSGYESSEDDEYIVSYNRFINYDVQPKKLDLKPRIHQKDMSLPGYPHVGPGNPIYPWPKNDIDAIAYRHDIDYGKAKTPWDVYEADKRFLEEMDKVPEETISDWFTKRIGYYGISFKHAFERRFGIMYPTFSQEQLKEFRKNPDFVKLEEKQIHNRLNIPFVAWHQGVKIKPETRNIKWDSARQVIKGIFKYLNKSKISDTQFTADIGKGTSQQGEKEIAKLVFKNTDNQWSEEISREERHQYIMDFLREYDETKMKDWFERYMHQTTKKDQIKLRQEIYDIKNDLNYAWGIYTANHRMSNGKFPHSFQSLDLAKDLYLNSYQDHVNEKIIDIEQTNYYLSTRDRQYNYDALQHYVNKTLEADKPNQSETKQFKLPKKEILKMAGKTTFDIISRHIRALNEGIN